MIRALIKVTSPRCCVEVGVLDGFSTIIIGHTLKELSKGKNLEGNHGFFAYDLFEQYTYTNSKYTDVKSRIDQFGLNEFVELRKKDLFEAVNDFEHESIDFIHIDVSNTGEIINNVINSWDPKISPGGLLLFEGGSPLRDEVSWMNHYKKDKIVPVINSNVTLNTNYTSLVLHPYPSMMVCCKNIQADKETSKKFGYDDFEQGTIHGKIDDSALIRLLSGGNDRI